MEIPNHWKRFAGMDEATFRQKFNQGSFGDPGSIGQAAAKQYMDHLDRKLAELRAAEQATKEEEDRAREIGADARDETRLDREEVRDKFTRKISLLALGVSIASAVLAAIALWYSKG